MASARMQSDVADCLQKRRHHGGIMRRPVAQGNEDVIVVAAEMSAPLQIPVQAGLRSWMQGNEFNSSETWSSGSAIRPA